MGNALKQYLLLLGGFLGFSTNFAMGLVAGNDISKILFDASIGCVAGGLLFKWVSVILVECVVLQRRKLAMAQAAAASAAAAAPKPMGGKK